MAFCNGGGNHIFTWSVAVVRISFLSEANKVSLKLNV